MNKKILIPLGVISAVVIFLVVEHNITEGNNGVITESEAIENVQWQRPLRDGILIW